MRKKRDEDEQQRQPAAKPAQGGLLPGKRSILDAGFDEPLLDLQRSVGNRELMRLMQQGTNDSREGAPLEPGVRAFMEGKFGADFASVRIHSGAWASSMATGMGSAAFAHGENLYFGSGRYSPHTPQGTQLLSHELAHVLQQRQGRSGGTQSSQDAAESEAASAASGISKGHGRVNVRTAIAPGIARQKEPAPPAPKAQMYQYTFEGKTVTLTEEEYKHEIAKTVHKIEIELKRVEDYAAIHRDTHDDFLKNTHNIFGIVSDIVANTAPPQLGIWSWPRSAINAGREALKNGKVEIAARQLKLAQDAFRDAQREWNSYLEKTISGAETTKSFLETTRDVSFAIAIGTAAVVAAPVVAAGLATAGATGAVGTVATGAVITAGGGVAGAGLRAGSAAAGQKLAFGHVNTGDIAKEAKEGFKHGAIDAGTAFVTAGTGRLLGEGASVGGRVVRHAVAGGVGGGFSSGAEAIAEGKSAKEVLSATGKGVASGFVGGGVTSKLGGAGQQSAVRRIVSGTAGSVAAGTTAAVLSGGSREDVKHAAVTSLITGLAGSSASPTHPGTGPGPEEHPSVPRRTAIEPEPPATRVKDPISLEEFRQKKLASRPKALPEETGPTPGSPKAEAKVSSLEEARQRKRIAAAKKPEPPGEPQSQAKPQVQEEVQQAEIKQAVGAEGQTPQSLETNAPAERRLKVVASAGGGGGRSRPGGDLGGVNEFREREFSKRIPSAKQRVSGPESLSEHIEELGETKKIRDFRKGQRGRQVDEEAQLHREVGRAVEPVEVELFGGDLIAKGATAVHPNHEFPDWLRKAFPKSGRSATAAIKEGPDIVAIDTKRGKIVVGDVTAKPGGDHLTKTVSDAHKVAAALPEDLKDFEVVAQERYYGADQEYSGEIVVKPGIRKNLK